MPISGTKISELLVRSTALLLPILCCILAHTMIICCKDLFTCYCDTLHTFSFVEDIFFKNRLYGTSYIFIPKWRKESITVTTSALIPTKFCSVIKASQYSSWVGLSTMPYFPCSVIKRSGWSCSVARTTTLHPFYSSMDFVRDYLGELVPQSIWILLKQEWQWHQLGHMQICTSSAPRHLVARNLENLGVSQLRMIISVSCHHFSMLSSVGSGT